MRVSFIIPYYNVPICLLRECLDSIFCLPCDAEVILIDDGSDVSPMSFLRDYPQTIIHRWQPNQGSSEARNVGLSMATGDYIQFVDADDKLLCRPYTDILEIAERQRPDVLRFRFGDGRSSARIGYPYIQTSGGEYLSGHNILSSSCVMLFKRELATGLRFPKGRTHEDEYFTPMLLLKAGRLIVSDTPAYYYRFRSGSAMHDQSKRHIIRRLEDKLWVIGQFSDSLCQYEGISRNGMERRIAQVTMDLIVDTMMLTRSRRHTEKIVRRLKRQRLFPLPCRPYTPIYLLFARISRYKVLRNMLTCLISFLCKK